MKLLFFGNLAALFFLALDEAHIDKLRDAGFRFTLKRPEIVVLRVVFGVARLGKLASSLFTVLGLLFPEILNQPLAHHFGLRTTLLRNLQVALMLLLSTLTVL
jgi:hypothetical protein